MKHAFAVAEDLRFVYGDEGPIAFEVAAARIRAQEYRRAARPLRGPTRAALLIEARVQEALADQLAPTVGLSADDSYLLPGGGFDVPRRLADARAEYPDLVALDADAYQVEGDEIADSATGSVALTIPVSIAFLLGAAAGAWPSLRRRLLLGGWMVVGATTIVAIVFEVV